MSSTDIMTKLAIMARRGNCSIADVDSDIEAKEVMAEMKSKGLTFVAGKFTGQNGEKHDWRIVCGTLDDVPHAESDVAVRVLRDIVGKADRLYVNGKPFKG